MLARTSATVALLVLLCSPGTAAAAPPEDVRIEGIPEIPAELEAQVARYQNARSAHHFDWHPTRRELLIGTRFGDTTQIHVVTQPGGARRQLTFFPEPVRDAAFVPASGGASLVLLKDVGGSEMYQIFRTDLRDGSTTLLTDGESRNGAATFNHAGDRLAFTSTARNGKDYDIYLMDPADPASRSAVAEREGAWSVLDWSPDDTALLLRRYVSVEHSELHLLDLASGEARALAGVVRKGQRTVAYRGAEFAHDGDRVFVVTDRDGEFIRLGVIELAGGRYTPLSVDEPWDVTDYAVTEDGMLAAYVVNRGGQGVLHLVDLAAGTELPAPQLPVGQVGNLLFRPGTHELALWQSTDRTPGDVSTYDVDSGRLERWTFSEVGGLNADAFPRTEVVDYPTFDGLDGAPRSIPLLITRPDPERFPGPRPVLIRIHGGPASQSTPRFLSSWTYLVEEMGVCFLQPNVRGSSGYGRAYRQLDDGTLREDSVRDIGALLDWIATQDDLDPSRVAVYGGSYGGYMALASLIHHGDRIRCGGDYVGISNFVTFLENTKEYRRDLRRVEYGDERDPSMRAFLESISPTTRAGDIHVPLLVVQGANDPRVPASEAEQIVEAVRGEDNTVWYLLAEDEGHGFRKKPNRDYLFEVMFLFL
ncbi:MAG: prolyl oligopeptidase family serine peptidase, partial [Myxococcota bacterium]|nr:prolyl oligopeptidase family serine peptidase [Myxococcota bacterium]